MHVPLSLYASSYFFQKTKAVWKLLGNLETLILKDEICSIHIKNPIYIAGVARSGSTILLEMLNQHPQLTSHRYSDFPNVYTPYWRNWLKQRTSTKQLILQERAHKDRIKITEHSPEAIEEVLWIDFFKQLHQDDVSQILDGTTKNLKFEKFYKDHIKKLLLVRRKQRYLCKGNYNLTRLGYIQKLFPDAKFIIPVRNPVNHIASCIKQDNLYSKNLANNPRAMRYLKWAGHFEFGPNKHSIYLNNSIEFNKIKQAFETDDKVSAWAYHWNSLYKNVCSQINEDEKLKSASLFMRYEDLCNNSEESITGILLHCNIEQETFEEIRKEYVKKLNEPSYYEAKFTQKDLCNIENICGATARSLGY